MSYSNKTALDIIANRKKELAIKEEANKPSHLAPIKYPQTDFFIADIFDTVTYRSDLASMEYPLFALKAGDTRSHVYEHDGLIISIDPNRYGVATMHDKDIWIYCISKICQAMYEGEEIHRKVRFTIYDYLKTTNRYISGSDYERTKEALERLKGTSVKVESENKKERIARSFSLISDWYIVEEKDGRMIRVEVEIPQWLFDSVANKQVLSISPDYFRLRRPLDRRIYELARKHCGYQSSWKIGLDLLHRKSGSTGDLRKFRLNIKSLAESDELPDYVLRFDHEKDMVIFKKRSKNK